MKRLIVVALLTGASFIVADPAKADPIKECGTSGPVDQFSTSQKGSCNSSHDPVCVNPGGNVNESSAHCR